MGPWQRQPLDAVEAIVFSCNRAQQLDAFLQTCDLYARALLQSMSVVYRATDADFERAYDRLAAELPHVRWVREQDFREDVLTLVGDRPYSVFQTDDDLYYAPVDSFVVGGDIACFAFRLGFNTTYCYPLDFEEQVTPHLVERDWIAWRWREHGRGAFGYPLALNGHVFASSDVARWLGESDFANPNELEVALQAFRDELPPLMASFTESRLVNVPANLVNTTFANRNAGTYDTRDLNERFLRGERIDVAAMDFSRVHAAHEEFDYVFRATQTAA